MTFHDPLVILMTPSIVLLPMGLWACWLTWKGNREKAKLAQHDFKETHTMSAKFRGGPVGEYVISAEGDGLVIVSAKPTFKNRLVRKSQTGHFVPPRG